ncbi:MAG: NFACT RNA binding domain-containing protein [Herpetosiphon sp.]
MYVDALTINAVVADLREALMGGRVQRVVQPSAHSLGLEVYAGQRATVLLSAHPQRARIHLVNTKPTRGGDGDTPLLLLMRKYVKHGFITAIEQPPLERIVALSITKYPGAGKDDDDVAEEQRTRLIIEILGTRSNILLVDASGRIMDAARRVGTDQRRPVFPHLPYAAPAAAPAEGDPRAATGSLLRALLPTDRDDLIKGLVRAFRGVSPQVAREAVFRATGSVAPQRVSDDVLNEIATELVGLYTEPLEPCVVRIEGRVAAFAPYALKQWESYEPRTTISAALEEFFAAEQESTQHGTRRLALMARLQQAYDRLQRQRNALVRELDRAQGIDQLRWEGEMIYGYLHAIAPGQRELIVDGKAIKLDPDKTAAENAQSRFRTYDKLKGAMAGVPERLSLTEGRLAYLDETLALAEVADGFDALTSIEREAEHEGFLKANTKGKTLRAPKAKPLQLTSSEGISILVGRSAGQNDEVTFHLAQGDDVWLHARGMPGAHVVIRSGGAVDDQTLLEAAGLALYFSKGRNQTSGDVSVCRQRDVRKVPGGPPGLVQLRHERTLHVRPCGPQQLGRGGNDGLATDSTVE